VPSEYTFGWNTSLVKRTRGGFSGYCSPKVMRRENTPPACDTFFSEVGQFGLEGV
jgi:hypothetical protein